MSLAIDLTNNQVEIEKAEREASALIRQYKAVLPPTLYSDLQLKLCVIASECTKLKSNLGTLRMIGELDQRPPEVTAESLELSQHVALWITGSREEVERLGSTRLVPLFPEHPIRDESAAFAQALERTGDDTLSERSAA